MHIMIFGNNFIIKNKRKKNKGKKESENKKVVCFFEGDVNKVFNFKLSDGNEDFIDDAKFLMHRAYLCRFLIEKINEIDIKG